MQGDGQGAQAVAAGARPGLIRSEGGGSFSCSQLTAGMTTKLL